MERKVSVYPFPFGTRVFMHRNGVIREAETPEEALEKLKEMAEDGTKNGWDEDRVGLESSEFDYYEVEYPTVEENKGATIFISHLDSCLGWDNEEEEK